jgi:hypothetical protein
MLRQHFKLLCCAQCAVQVRHLCNLVTHPAKQSKWVWRTDLVAIASPAQQAKAAVNAEGDASWEDSSTAGAAAWAGAEGDQWEGADNNQQAEVAGPQVTELLGLSIESLLPLPRRAACSEITYARTAKQVRVPAVSGL